MNGIAGSFATFPNNAEAAAKVPWTGRKMADECSAAGAWHGHDAAFSTKGALSSAATRLATAANRNGHPHRQGQSTRIRAPAVLRTPPHDLQVERRLKAESALSNAHALGQVAAFQHAFAPAYLAPSVLRLPSPDLP
ncbi:hypothetical protein V5785_22675, partial [Bacillus subtilis]